MVATQIGGMTQNDPARCATRGRSTRMRLLLIYPSCNLDVNPTLPALLRRLAARGHRVDVVMERPGDFSVPVSPAPGVRFRFLPSGGVSLSGVSARQFPARLARALVRPSVRRCYRLWEDLAGVPQLSACCYDAIVGIDPAGLAVAHRLNRFARRPLIYLSFEILFRAEVVGALEAAIKSAEEDASREVVLTLIQDDERATALASELHLPRERMALVPVAPEPVVVHREKILHRTLGIPEDRRIVLYLGQVSAWTGRDELADLIETWPERYCLVLHFSSRGSGRLAPALRRWVDQGRVFLSHGPIPQADLPALVASADFGLAPYRAVADSWDTGMNVHHLGLASGKVAYYALCGLPILARPLPVFEREFAQYDCGRLYRRPEQTGALLEELGLRYKHHRAEARRFYDERLDPRKALEGFCERLEAEVRSHRRRRDETRSAMAGAGVQPVPAESSPAAGAR